MHINTELYFGNIILKALRLSFDLRSHYRKMHVSVKLEYVAKTKRSKKSEKGKYNYIFHTIIELIWTFLGCVTDSFLKIFTFGITAEDICCFFLVFLSSSLLTTSSFYSLYLTTHYMHKLTNFLFCKDVIQANQKIILKTVRPLRVNVNYNVKPPQSW